MPNKLILLLILLSLAACSQEQPAPQPEPEPTPEPEVVEQPPTPEEWLAENAKREGVVVTESGLQYEIIETGEGKSPVMADHVLTHYEGRLMDGTVFDSSLRRGVPVELPVDKVIGGWSEALQLMQEGDKWKLYIPPDLGYGGAEVGKIPPDSVLVFEVELLQVKSG